MGWGGVGVRDTYVRAVLPMRSGTAELRSKPVRGRVSVAAREIRDAVEAIATELGREPMAVSSPEVTRERSIAMALAMMAGRMAADAGLKPVEPLFGCIGIADFSTGSLREASRRLADWMDRHAQGDPLGSAYEVLLGTESRLDSAGRFHLEFRRQGRRKASGTFYTPVALVEFALDRALEPVLDARLAGRDGTEAVEILLQTSVLDPSVGGGRFLLAAARRIAARVKSLTGEDRLPEILQRCVHGIDIDSIAAEICRVQLWIAAGDPGLAPSVFATNIRTGNALLGATRAMVEAGIPDEAYRMRPGDDASACATLRKRNRLERDGSRVTRGDPDWNVAADLWCAAFLDRKCADLDGTPTTAHVRDSSRTPAILLARVERLLGTGRLLHPELAFPAVFARGGFDAIIGNPPFLNQLESGTSHDPARAALLRCVSAGAIRGYADTSAAFLERCSHWLAPAGRLALVQPHAILAARDAEAIRASVLQRCSLTDLWIARERIFDTASVHVCLPVLERGAPRAGFLARFVGREFRRFPDRAIDQDGTGLATTWAPLVAAANGVPEIEVAGGGTIADLADATADFRDQYYGLAGFLVEDAAISPAERGADLYPKLVTTGLIDLAECRWGIEPTRVLKLRWNAPRIDRRLMAREGNLAGWIADRSRPKIILATQTKVLEAFVDAEGELIPSLPLITVTPRLSGDLWQVAAAIASPVASAVACSRHAGAALTVDAIKLSASQALRLPLPRDASAWQHGARALQAAQRATDGPSRRLALRCFGHAMARSYGLSEAAALEVEDWWASRLSV